MIRNAPVMLYHLDFSKLTLPVDLSWNGEYVLVLNTAALSSVFPEDQCSDRKRGLPPLFWGAGPAPPIGTKRITVVFWTGQPGRLWIPPCAHLIGWPWSVQEHTDRMRACDVMPQIWKEIMDLAKPTRKNSKGTLTFVNAAAVMNGSYPTTAMSARGTSSLEAYLRHRFADSFQSASYDFPQVCLRTMQEWIREGNADDVFSHKELEPFLGTSG